MRLSSAGSKASASRGATVSGAGWRVARFSALRSMPVTVLSASHSGCRHVVTALAPARVPASGSGIVRSIQPTTFALSASIPKQRMRGSAASGAAARAGKRHMAEAGPRSPSFDLATRPCSRSPRALCAVASTGSCSDLSLTR